MDKTIMKYNPAFLSTEELVASFVVRHRELETIVRIIKENVTKSNQHILVIGPRGIGKTMLVLRAAEEVRRNKELSKKWYPLVFSEESYQVSTCGEFWLESLFHLGQQEKEDERWRRTYEELRDEAEENRLRERALAQLMDFADEQGKRILLVVENLNMLLGDQLRDEDAWAMRHTLQNEPRIMLLASATSRFEQVEVEGKPMFDLFRFVDLKPLDRDECSELWAAVTRQKTPDRRIRPLEILTGGNPRLLAIVSNFAAELSLKELINDLMRLVDEHTEYFKSHLDNLPAVERKAYIALAEIWDPAAARQVADAARLEVSKTSALLGRLIERGAVVEANGRGKAKLYQVAERMYNIYYLMRRQGGASGRVRAVVNFMVSFYSAKELVKAVRSIAEEACQLAMTDRTDHYMAYTELISHIEDKPAVYRIIESTTPAFFEGPAIPTSLKKVFKNFEETMLLRRISDLLKKYESIKNNPKKLEKEEKYFRDFVQNHPQKCGGLVGLGMFLHLFTNRFEEAEKLYREAIQINPKVALVWLMLGTLLGKDLERYDESADALQKLVNLDPKNAGGWNNLGMALQGCGKLEEAEKAFRTAIKLEKKLAEPLFNLGRNLIYQGQLEEGEKYLRKALKQNPNYYAVDASLIFLLLIIGDDYRRNEGWEILKGLVRKPEVPQKNVSFATELFVTIAAIGHSREALEILRESAWAEILEPIVVALRLMAGEDVKAAAEIMEVAKDVVKRIEERRKQIIEDGKK